MRNRLLSAIWEAFRLQFECPSLSFAGVADGAELLSLKSRPHGDDTMPSPLQTMML